MKKAFVITGASRGLGRILGKEAFSEGYPVALIARNESDLKDAQREIAATGTKNKLSIHPADLSDGDQTHRIFQEILKTHGGIEVLVNNAATWMGRKSSRDLTREDILTSLELNFFTAFNATKETMVIRGPQSETPLTIINMGATASLRAGIGSAPFCIAKAALRSFSQSLAKELGPEGVHVAHLIIDGLIDNERTRKLNPNTPSDNFISPISISKSIMHVIQQDKSCWTFEWDVRPYNEKWQ